MGEYETIRKVTREFCQPNPIIFEIGCYDGTLTRAFYMNSQTRPHIYVAFEADPDNYIKILNNKYVPEEAIIVNKAVGASNGTVKFWKSSGKFNNEGNEYDVCGSLRPPKELNTLMPFIKFREIEVESITLDDYAKENNIDHVDLMLVDIQGAEKDMIAGAQELIKKTKFVYLEKCNAELYDGMAVGEELKTIMDQHGFDVYEEFENDIMFKNRNYGDVV